MRRALADLSPVDDPGLKWLAFGLALVRSAPVEPPAEEGVTWVFQDGFGQKFGVLLFGDESYFRAGLAIVLAEQLPSCGWTEPDEDGVRWLDNGDLQELMT